MFGKKRTLKSSVIEKHHSYIMAVPKDESSIATMDMVIERIKTSEVFEFVAIKNSEHPIVLFRYQQKEYEAEIFMESADIPEIYNINHRFIEEEFEALNKAQNGIMVSFLFGESAMVSFHMQIRLLQCLVPDILGIVDFSSMKIISGKWAMLAAKSEVPPSPEYLYSVHAVSGKNGEVWLHTHGLNRCGLIELEILGSHEKTYQTHYDVIKALAGMGISKGELVDEEEPKYVIDFGEDCLVATWVDWSYALSYAKKIKTGGKADRDDSHNGETGVIFAYRNERDYEKKKLSPITIYDDVLQNNPLIMFTTEETNRMKALATERFSFFEEHFQKDSNEGIMKFGLEVDEEFRSESNQKEHIWFGVKEIKGDQVIAVLTQEPYYLKDFQKDNEYTLDKSLLTDWIIYTEKETITPDSVYVLV